MRTLTMNHGLTAEERSYITADPAAAAKGYYDRTRDAAKRLEAARAARRAAEQEARLAEQEYEYYEQRLLAARIAEDGPACGSVRAHAQDLHHYLAALCGEASVFEGQMSRPSLLEGVERANSRLCLNLPAFNTKAGAARALAAVRAWGESIGINTYKGELTANEEA